MLVVNYSDSSDEDDMAITTTNCVNTPSEPHSTTTGPVSSVSMGRQAVAPLENIFLKTKHGSLFGSMPAPKTALKSKKRKMKKSAKKKRKKSKKVSSKAQKPKKIVSKKEIFLSSLPKPVASCPLSTAVNDEFEDAKDPVDEVEASLDENEESSLLGRHLNLKRRGENDSKPIGMADFGLSDDEDGDKDKLSETPADSMDHFDPAMAYGAALVNAHKSAYNPRNFIPPDERPAATVELEQEQSPSPPLSGDPLKLSKESGVEAPYWAKAMKSKEGNLLNIHSNEVQNPERWVPDLDDLELRRMHREQKKFAVPVYNPSTGKAHKSFVPKTSHKRKHQINTLAMEYQAKQIELIRRRGMEFKNKRTTAQKYGW